MYQKIIKNDIKKSKLITTTIAGFILMAALFTALGVSMLVNLFGAIDNLSEQSKTPDFFLMHRGELNQERMEQFAADHEDIEEMQVGRFLNIEGTDFLVNGEPVLADSVQDNGLTYQNEKFDYILNLDNEIIHPNDGEVWVPIYYYNEGLMQIGDQLSIQGVEFIIKGFTHDALMNAPMTSSKRFLLSEHDYMQLESGGVLEYTVEFLLRDGVNLAQFESDYINAGLENNGPSGTQGLLKLMNGLSDGVMIAILMLISILVLIIAFLCVRFTLISKMEEDYKEIGVLKAVGLRVSEIKKLYLVKYGAIALLSSGLGYLISLALQKPSLKNIHMSMGQSNRELLAILLGGCGAALVMGVVILYVWGVLRRFRKISPVQAIRFGAPAERVKGKKGITLEKNHLFSANAFLGIKDVWLRKGLYLIMLVVFIISCFLMVVPQNIGNTLRDPGFMANMGIGEFDVFVNSQLNDRIPEMNAEIADVLSEHKAVERYTVYTCWSYDMVMSDGSAGKLKVTLGDHKAFPLNYIEGQDPETEDEIALSLLNSQELEKQMGDQVTLMVNGQERNLTVCGLYSDVTNGGFSAKALLAEPGEQVMWGMIPIELKESENGEELLSMLAEKFPGNRQGKSQDYREQILGTVTNTVETASIVAIGVSMFLTILITLLFMKMLIVKDRYQIAVLKSLGFTDEAIKRQYMVRAGIVMVIGVALGTIAANTLGEFLGIAMMSSFGVSTFDFQINGILVYLAFPLLIALCVYAAARFSTSSIRNIKISEYIKE